MQSEMKSILGGEGVFLGPDQKGRKRSMQHQMRRFKNRNEKEYERNEDPMSNIYLNWEKKLQVMQMCRVKF